MLLLFGELLGAERQLTSEPMHAGVRDSRHDILNGAPGPGLRVRRTPFLPVLLPVPPPT